jgi:hypothetical protein
MTSKLKVNLINDSGDNNIITSDGAGSFTASSSLASSVQSVGGLQNTSAFFAYLSANQAVSNNAFTKMQCNTEELDTNGDYDNATNYRFTPSVAGKYYIYGVTTTGADAGQLNFTMAVLYKNGSQITENVMDFRTGTGGADNSVFTSIITDFNGSTDYIELYGRINTGTGPVRFRGGSVAVTYFGGYKLIGA